MLPEGTDRKLREHLEKSYRKYGKYKLITTVQHSGTHSLLAEHPEYKHWHCDEFVLDLITSNLNKMDVLTTYRTPERVAASWHNRQIHRGHISMPAKDNIKGRWERVWKHYGEIIKLPCVKIFPVEDLKHKEFAHADKLNLHAYLDSGNMADYYKMVDSDLIEYAYKQIQTGENNATGN